MPLSEPAPRAPLHRRSIECRGYRREDGLWDIEGHLVDVKAYEVPGQQRSRAPGQPVHDMWIRITIDAEMRIHALEAVTDTSPFEICPHVTGRFRQLEGLTIGPGWTAQVMERVGGVKGCTHLVELLRPIATTAFQTLYEERRAEAERGAKPRFIDTCHALASDGPVVKAHWPRFHVCKGEPGG